MAHRYSVDCPSSSIFSFRIVVPTCSYHALFEAPNLEFLILSLLFWNLACLLLIGAHHGCAFICGPHSERNSTLDDCAWSIGHSFLHGCPLFHTHYTSAAAYGTMGLIACTIPHLLTLDQRRSWLG